jgi:hypothetical protein
MQNGVLATLFIIEDELHSNAGLSRPLRMRRMRSITNEISRIK